MYLPLPVRKTSRHNSILHNSRQQTFTNDNKREEVHPTKISSVYSKVPYITYSITDVKLDSLPSR